MVKILPDEEYLQIVDAKLDKELETCRLKKEKERGGFEKKVLLKEVIKYLI